MKKLLSILLAFLFLLPFTFAKTEAKHTGAEKFNAEINYIEPANCAEAEFLMDLDNNPSDYPYTPVAGDLCVFADGATTGTYKCAQYNTSWHAGTVVEKTIAQLQAALANGTHVAVFGDMYHKHGLETADTSDDVSYDKLLTSAGGNLDTGNYYLTEDITLENDIEVGANIYVKIDLCGHVINLNNHQIKNNGNLTIESCKNTAHKFTTNSNGTYTWNETSGDTTFNGGIITGDFICTDGRRYIMYTNTYLKMNNISIIGVHMEAAPEFVDGTSLINTGILVNSSGLFMNNVKLLGNEGCENCTTCFIYCDFAQQTVLENFVAKNNIAAFSGSVVCGHDGSDFDLSNVLITDNKCMEGGFAPYGGTVYLRNKIVIDGNKALAGSDCNVCFDGTNFFLDNEKPLQAGSKIGFSYIGGAIPEGVQLDVVHVDNYTNEYKSYFSSDSDSYCFGYSAYYASLHNKIDEQPTSSNGYQFVLNDNAITGYDVSYQWYTCDIEEIAPKTGNIQNYVSTQYLLHQMFLIDSIFKNGYWDSEQSGAVGVVLDLKAGDVVYAKANAITQFYLAEAPDHMVDPINYREDKNTYFIIQKDGIYSISCFDVFKLYVLHIGNKVSGQTTNTLTITDPGNYACIATFTKQGKKISAITSNIAEVNGLNVTFSVPDSTIYVPTINYIKNGSTIARPEDPSSIKVLGWYKEPELINEWDFDNDVVIEDITLYAKYELDIDISVKMILVNQAQTDCIVTVGEGLQLTLDNFYSFTLNGTTYLKSELDLVDPLDETKGYTNGTFTVEEGCIKITLPQNYINTFGLGTYDLSVQLTGMLNSESVEGMVLSGSVQVVDKLPGTGVETNNSLFEIIALTSIACAACYIVLQKKHN